MAAWDPSFLRSHGFGPGSHPVDPIVRVVFFLGPILFATGYGLLGTSLLRIKAYPSLALCAVVVGALLVGLWPLLPRVVQHWSAVVSLIYTLGIAWIGYVLARPRTVAREAPRTRGSAVNAVLMFYCNRINYCLA